MIYLDNIIFSLQRAGGISVVWAEHLMRILKAKQDVRFFDYANGAENIFRRNIDIPADKILYGRKIPMSLERYLNPRLSGKAQGIFHSSYFRTVNNPDMKNITTVHDFTYEYYASGIKKFIHCKQKYDAIRNSDAIICISENTKKDLLKFLPDINPLKIHVVYNGVSEDFCQLTNIAAENIHPYEPGNYLLFVGARTGYKNFIKMVECLKGSNENLLIVGGGEISNQEKELLDSYIGAPHYRWVGRIDNTKLNLLYNQAKCLVYPSAYEGFGIPPLEAQKAGCPVIALNTSSLPEVMADSGILLGDLTTENFNNAFSLLASPAERKNLIEAGINNSKRFSWDLTFEQTMEVYNTLM